MAMNGRWATATWGALLAVAALLVGDGCVFDSSGRRPPPEACGNGVVETGEACDDGNTSGGDGCAGDCSRIDWICGDGVEECGETCDDGNIVGGDGCSASCQLETACGDGAVDTADGEVCDDGNIVGGDGCSANCLSDETCGNGVLDVVADEACDDGNIAAGDGCSWDCRSNEVCGNGVIDSAIGEACDDGNAAVGDGCNTACQPDPGWTCTGEPSVCNPLCGDGIIVAGEQCDDGNANPGDGCDSACQLEPGWDCSANPGPCASICGDGLTVGAEACDDGNTANGDGCEGNCTPTVDCWSQSYGGKSYFFCVQPRNWHDANALCTALGYHLVTIVDGGEDTWVADTAAAYGVGAWWIGMNDLAQEGAWGWIDGSPVTHTHWAQDEPNNVGGVEHCGVLWEATVPAYTWNDADCYQLKACVCEYM